MIVDKDLLHKIGDLEKLLRTIAAYFVGMHVLDLSATEKEIVDLLLNNYYLEIRHHNNLRIIGYPQ